MRGIIFKIAQGWNEIKSPLPMSSASSLANTLTNLKHYKYYLEHLDSQFNQNALEFPRGPEELITPLTCHSDPSPIAFAPESEDEDSLDQAKRCEYEKNENGCKKSYLLKILAENRVS